MAAFVAAPPGRDCPPRLADLEAERASYRVEVPERFNAVRAIVDTWADEEAAALAVLSLDGDGEIVARQTAADLALASRQVADALIAEGVRKGDHVFVMLPRVPQWYATIRRTELRAGLRVGTVEA